jgi:hypothetical protein
MDRELHDSLSRAAEAARLRDCLRAQRDTLASSLAIEKPRLTALGSKLDRERKDVERLEGISLQRLAAAIAGNRDDALVVERQEAAIAELRYAEHSRLVTTMMTELDAIDRRIAELGDVDAIHLEAMEAKGRMLMALGDEPGRLVAALVEQFTYACAMDRELGEARDCGAALYQQLTATMFNLRTALETTTSELLAGGPLTTAFKYDAVKRASRHMQWSRILLERFHKELSDVARGLSPHAPYDVLTIRALPGPTFGGYMWGGILDGAVRGRLKHIGRTLGSVRQEVRRCTDDVARALEDTRRARQELWTRLYAVISAA